MSAKRKKKAPALIDRQATRTQEHEKGGLSYMGEVKVSKRRKISLAGLNLVLPILVSVVLAAFMLVQFAPSKADVTKTSLSISQSTTQLQQQIDQLSLEVTDQAGQIKALQSQLDKLEVKK